MDSLEIISWLSKSAYDSTILRDLVELKKILVEDLQNEDKELLFSKYPRLKKIINNLIKKLSKLYIYGKC